MEKRGQVTTFIIVGAVALAAILLVFFLRNTLFETIVGAERVSSYLEGQMNSIGDEVDRCIDSEGGKALNILGKQGGYFEPKSYLYYYGNKIAYLCTDIPEDLSTCRNNMLVERDVELRLDEYMRGKMKDCINLDGFNVAKLYDYELVYDLNSLNVTTTIMMENVMFNVSFPVTVKKDEYVINKNSFLHSVKIPLGEIIDTVNGMLNLEATLGTLSTLSLDLFSGNRYLIKKYRPMNDKLFTIQIYDYNYIFQFAIKEEKSGKK